jgi:hypothetical protein
MRGQDQLPFQFIFGNIGWNWATEDEASENKKAVFITTLLLNWWG